MAANLKLVYSTKHEYPRTVDDSTRPYRMWDSKEKRDVPHRYYSDVIRCHNQAMILVRWEKVGTTFEIYDIRTGKWHGTYQRRVDSLLFMKP